jgi:hypothetical protein
MEANDFKEKCMYYSNEETLKHSMYLLFFYLWLTTKVKESTLLA